MTSIAGLPALRHRLDRNVALGSFLRRIRRYKDQMMRGGSRVGNIAMLHAGRCGSSVLADLLKQHPDVQWTDEPFEVMPEIYYRMDSRRRAHERVANLLFRHDTRWWGFDAKILPEQHLHADLADRSIAGFVEMLEQLDVRHFILLGRRNHLRRAVSIVVGLKTGQWNTAGAVAKPTVRLDPQRFQSYGATTSLLDYFRRLDQVHDEARRVLRDRHFLELEYEADIERDPRGAYDKTCAWLGMTAQPVDVRLRKINTRPLCETVENFAEIKALLRGSPYEWMLAG